MDNWLEWKNFLFGRRRRRGGGGVNLIFEELNHILIQIYLKKKGPTDIYIYISTIYPLEYWPELAKSCLDMPMPWTSLSLCKKSTEKKFKLNSKIANHWYSNRKSGKTKQNKKFPNGKSWGLPPHVKFLATKRSCWCGWICISGWQERKKKCHYHFGPIWLEIDSVKSISLCQVNATMRHMYIYSNSGKKNHCCYHGKTI